MPHPELASVDLPKQTYVKSKMRNNAWSNHGPNRPEATHKQIEVAKFQIAVMKPAVRPPSILRKLPLQGTAEPPWEAGKGWVMGLTNYTRLKGLRFRV